MLRPPHNYTSASTNLSPSPTSTTTTTTGSAISSPLKRLRPNPPTTEEQAPLNLLGPTLEIPTAFSDHHHKRLTLALQSNLQSELTWSLNILTLLSFREKEDLRRDATPLAKIPNLLDALLQIIHQYRDTEKGSRDENEFGFNLEEEDGMVEKLQFAVAASNVLRNFAFVPDNEVIMAQHAKCLETLFNCIQDYKTEDEELVTNALETIVNLAPILNLQTFSSSKPSTIKLTVKQAVQAIMGMLQSSVKTWHCAAAELLGRLIINPENEQFLSAFAPEIYKRLVDLLGLPAVDAQAASIGALYNLSEVSLDCRLKLVSERWAIDRLLKIIKTPHPVPEVCRKAALIIESLVSEPQNRALLLTYENTFAEILFSEGRHSDTFARILYVLTSRQDNKVATTPAVWGI